MAKLASQITPEELLAEIKAGVLKSEIIKQYKTSDQELAMLLLPLYRSGAMTRDEFNDFFKGISLKPKTAEAPETAYQAPSPVAEESEPETATQARRYLSSLLSKKAAGPVPQEAEKSPAVIAAPASGAQKALETGEITADSVELLNVNAQELEKVEEERPPVILKAADRTEPAKAAPVPEEAPPHEERPQQPEVAQAPAPDIEPVAEAPRPEPVRVAEKIPTERGADEHADLRPLLDLIMNKLDAIENRLSHIEKSLEGA